MPLLPSPLPSPLRVSCGQPTSPAKENWTVSMLGSLSGIFDIESPEEDDDLLVPSTTQPPLSAAMNDNVELSELATSPKVQKRPAVTQLRSCSAAFQTFLNEQALAEVEDPTLAAHNDHHDKSGFSLSAMEIDPSQLSTPPASAVTTNPLLLDWMNQSMSSDEFGDLLQEFDREADPSSSSSSSSLIPSFLPFSSSAGFSEHDLCTTLDVSQVTFESLLASQQQPAPAPAPVEFQEPKPKLKPVVVEVPASPAPALAAAKRRGRPPKSLPTLEAAPAPRKAAAAAEKLREPSPSTPFSPAPGTPFDGVGPLVRPSPDDKEAYDRYLRYRRSNNDSASKSRLRRKEREKFNAEMVSTLQEQNVDLKHELALLRGEFQQLQGMLDSYLLQQQSKAN